LHAIAAFAYCLLRQLDKKKELITESPQLTGKGSLTGNVLARTILSAKYCVAYKLVLKRAARKREAPQSMKSYLLTIRLTKEAREFLNSLSQVIGSAPLHL